MPVTGESQLQRTYVYVQQKYCMLKEAKGHMDGNVQLNYNFQNMDLR